MPSEYFLKRMAEINADPKLRRKVKRQESPQPAPPVMSAEDAKKGPIEWPTWNPDLPAKDNHPLFNKEYVVDLRRSGVRAQDDGYIYFIADEDHTVVKIGRAVNPGTRLRELQTGNHLSLYLLHAFRADMGAEKLFHRKYKSRRMQGEWFKYTYDFEEFMDDEFDFRAEHLISDEEPLNMNQVSFLLDVLNLGRKDSDKYLTRLFEYLTAEKERGVPVDNDWIK